MFKRILAFINNAHLIVGVVIFGVGTFVATHGMMTGAYVGFTSTVLGFLAGHHLVENAVKDQNPQDNQKDSNLK